MSAQGASESQSKGGFNAYKAQENVSGSESMPQTAFTSYIVPQRLAPPGHVYPMSPENMPPPQPGPFSSPWGYPQLHQYQWPAPVTVQTPPGGNEYHPRVNCLEDVDLDSPRHRNSFDRDRPRLDTSFTNHPLASNQTPMVQPYIWPMFSGPYPSPSSSHNERELPSPSLQPRSLIIQDAQTPSRRPSFDDVSSPESERSPTTSFSVDSVPGSPVVGRQRGQKVPKITTGRDILNAIQQLKLTPVSFITDILKADSTSHIYRRTKLGLYDKPHHFYNLLNTIANERDGRQMLRSWIKADGIDILREVIHDEMEAAKPHLKMKISDVSLEYVQSWNPHEIMDKVAHLTPTWCAILEAATTPLHGDDARTRDRPRTRSVISAQVHHLRNQFSAKVQIGLGLAANAFGASRTLLDMLHSFSLSISFQSIRNTLEMLAQRTTDDAKDTAADAHGNTYDNFNATGSIHVEQRHDAPSKVRSGTFTILYKIPGARLEDMHLQPIMERLRKASPLKMSDLRMSDTARKSYNQNSTITIARILLKHSGPSSEAQTEALQRDAKLQHVPRRSPPEGHKTEFFPLRVTTIEEASIAGNILVHNDTYVHLLGMEPEHLSKYAIPCVNDQLTNSRIRGAQALRRMDVNAWERREVFQLAFGTFHLVMNLIWGILHNHRGKAAHLGTLSYYFSIMHKVRLANERPDYYTLLHALQQILEGLIVDAWRIKLKERKFPADFASFFAKKPTPEEIIEMADEIRVTHATIPPDDIDFPSSEPDPQTKESKRKKHSGTSASSDKTDTLYENTRLLIRDLLYVVELVMAMSSGDWGRIEDILPDIACMFRGVGSNNYSTEILHFLFNMKEVWTPQFAEIMRNMMLVNISGLPGKWMAIDLNIEHQIRNLKALFMAKGLYASWDRAGTISACIYYLYLLKQRLSKSIGLAYRGSSHTAPNTASSVSIVSAKSQEHNFLVRLDVDQRPKDNQPVAVTDALLSGYDKMESSSLTAFNKKMLEMRDGILEVDSLIEEDDDLPDAIFAPLMDPEDVPEDGDKDEDYLNTID